MQSINKIDEFTQHTKRVRYLYLHFTKYRGEASISDAISEVEKLIKLLPLLRKQLILEKKMSEEDKQFIDYSEIDTLLGIKK